MTFQFSISGLLKFKHLFVTLHTNCCQLFGASWVFCIFVKNAQSDTTKEKQINESWNDYCTCQVALNTYWSHFLNILPFIEWFMFKKRRSGVVIISWTPRLFTYLSTLRAFNHLCLHSLVLEEQHSILAYPTFVFVFFLFFRLQTKKAHSDCNAARFFGDYSVFYLTSALIQPFTVEWASKPIINHTFTVCQAQPGEITAQTNILHWLPLQFILLKQENDPCFEKKTIQWNFFYNLPFIFPCQ